MALHTELPIHRAGVDLLRMGFDLQKNMPRGLKHTLGEKIIAHCGDMLDCMALANATQREQRLAWLDQLLTHHRATTTLLRVGLDARAIPTGHWANAVQLLNSVGAQCGGWRNATVSKRAPAA